MGMKLFDEIEVASGLERRAGIKRVVISIAVREPGTGENLVNDPTEEDSTWHSGRR